VYYIPSGIDLILLPISGTGRSRKPPILNRRPIAPKRAKIETFIENGDDERISIRKIAVRFLIRRGAWQFS